MPKRYAARFRHHGPTISVGTFGSKEEAAAAVLGAKRMIEKGLVVTTAVAEPAKPTPSPPLRLVNAINGGTYDQHLDRISKAVTARQDMLSGLPKQSGFGIMAGKDDLAVRRTVYGSKLTPEQAQALSHRKEHPRRS